MEAKRALLEAVKVKPKSCWRLLNIQEYETMGGGFLGNAEGASRPSPTERLYVLQVAELEG